MNYTSILQEIYQEAKALPVVGNVAVTIPELVKADSNKFGIHLTTVDGEDFGVGDSNNKF
jgi:glutaminase